MTELPGSSRTVLFYFFMLHSERKCVRILFSPHYSQRMYTKTVRILRTGFKSNSPRLKKLSTILMVLVGIYRRYVTLYGLMLSFVPSHALTMHNLIMTSVVLVGITRRDFTFSFTLPYALLRYVKFTKDPQSHYDLGGTGGRLL